MNVDQFTGEVSDATGNPLYSLLRYQPNRFQTAHEYWVQQVKWYLLRGCHLSWKNVGSTGKILSLIPLNPDTVIRRQLNDGTEVLSGAAQWGYMKWIDFYNAPLSEFLSCKYHTIDGITPVSPIRYAADVIGLSMTALQHGNRVFNNDATPNGIVSVDGNLDDKALTRLAQAWAAGGSCSNYGKTRFLGDDAKYTRISMSNEDAQYLQTRRYSKEEICGIFRVPPHLIGDAIRAKGWSTLEQQNEEFLTFTLAPILHAFEQSCNRDLIPRSQWGKTFISFDTRDFMKADIKTRSEFYTQMVGIAVMSPNDVRKELGMMKRPGGDEYIRSTNTVIDSKSNPSKVDSEQQIQEEQSAEEGV
jgi:HK97 family phage portal protein